MDEPIGVFDSGLGGLTVVHAIRERIPTERLIYLGDTARVPYGTRSPETVLRYALACARQLVARDVKMLVVACNTVSAVAIDALRDALGIPVLGVIEPGARAGARASICGKVGVLATSGTVTSGAYERALRAENGDLQVFTQAAPLFVPLAEEGWVEGEVPERVAERYLAPFVERGIDSLVLGCTHYPLLEPVISRVAGRLFSADVRVVDSAEATALELAALLDDRGLRSRRGERGLEVLVTDQPRAFAEVASRFLGESLGDFAVESIDL
jgi:glutamate racemase